MKDAPNHPARSADFLSRLHDGELSASERAHFESHRAHCAECRRAAAEFEAALSLFRASRTSPPPEDLSARILRRLQASTPPRRSFGIVHGINLKWAAGFALALIAGFVGLSVILERESARKALMRETPIPVLLQKGEKPAPPPVRAAAAESSVSPPAGAKPAEADRDRAFAPEAAELRRPAPEKLAAGDAGTAREKTAAGRENKEAGELSDSLSTRRKDAPATGFARMERSGGEGAAAPSSASAEPGAPARFVVLAVDGQGTAPAVLNPDAAEMLSGLRGRQYYLVVEAGGRVRDARVDGAKPEKRLRAAQPTASLEKVSAPPSVWSLRFKTGDRPRRLLLRVE